MYGNYAKESSPTVTLDELLPRRELLEGLRKKNKQINPKYFYDEYGSKLFEEITRLPEYYPTRTELALLTRHRDDIADVLGQGQVLIEPGAGNCSKVRLLLPALRPACYVPIDISGEFLLAAAGRLQDEFSDVQIFPIADDMGAKISLPASFDNLPRTVFYPGSTIGNYEPEDALSFLRHVREIIGERGGLLIGIDLKKDNSVLSRAYNDSQGVTALFNLNILNHVNRLIGSDFNTSRFEHVAFYNRDVARIEMYLQSRLAHSVTTASERFEFEKGERIHTEYSYKYSLESFAELAQQAGLASAKNWVDEDNFFSLQYYRPL